MELSPTDARLNAIDSIDLYKTDEKYNFKLTDILRKRQRPLLLLLNQDGQLLHASDPIASTLPNGVDTLASAHVLDEAIAQAQKLFHEQLPVSSIVRQLVINKPGERCALVIIDNHFYCMRLFRLHNASETADHVYAALMEAIGKPNANNVDFDQVKGLFRLSNREVDVLGALMSGETDKQIAGQLRVSVETIRAYLKSIRAKLGVKTRTAIVSVVHNLQNEGLSTNIQ